jgi:hypothetical protein
MTVLELRHGSPNLMDVLPPSRVLQSSGETTEFRWTGERRLDTLEPLPAALQELWLLMSSDDEQDLRRGEEIVSRALPAGWTLDAAVSTASGKTLAYPSRHQSAYNSAAARGGVANVPQLLGAAGYKRVGSRYARPGATGVPGVRRVPGKDDLWVSDHGGDTLRGTFGPWQAYVKLVHGGDLAAAEAAMDAAAPDPTDGFDVVEPTPKDENPVVAELLKNAFFVMRSRKAFLGRYVEGGLPEFFRISELRPYYKNQEFMNGRRRLSPLDAWLEHPQRVTYDGVVFSPQAQTPRMLNLWQGFACKPVEGDCTKFLRHIHDNICAGNEHHYRWVLAWMAHSVQKIGLQRVGVTLVLRGEEGTGKGVFFNALGSLFGQHYVPVSNPRHLVGNFNAHLAAAAFVFADEALFAGGQEQAAALKALITEPTINIEYKGLEVITLDNHSTIGMATNSEWAVRAGKEARRFTVLDVSKGAMQNHKYFAAIAEELRNGGREALLHLLLNLPMHEYPNPMVHLNTQALEDQKTESLEPFEKWWSDVLIEGISGEWPEHVNTDILRKSYDDFIRAGNYKYAHLSSVKFGIKLQNISDGLVRRTLVRSGNERYRVYTLGDRAELVNSYQKFTKTTLEAPDLGFNEF